MTMLETSSLSLRGLFYRFRRTLHTEETAYKYTSRKKVVRTQPHSPLRPQAHQPMQWQSAPRFSKPPPAL